MQYFKRSSKSFSLTILTVIILTNSVLAQSGRGRPKVAPPPSPTATAAPEPINIPATAAVIKQEQAGTLSRFVLRNGLTLVISEHHSSPISAVVAYFKAGPLDGSGAAPASRLLARMMLHGTASRPDGRSLAELRALGAQVEATVLNDGTAYSLVAPSAKVNDALAILADMFQNPTLDAAAISRAIPFVIDEQKRSVALGRRALSKSEIASSHSIDLDEDPASYSLSRVVDLALGTDSPESLRSMTRDQLIEFHRTHYRPDNLIISIAGDVSTFNTLVAIQKLYGAFGVKPEEAPSTVPAPGKGKPNAQSAPTQKAQVERVASQQNAQTPAMTSAAPALDKLLYATDRADISQSLVSIAFRVPGAESSDALAIEVLAAIAGMGKSSRLNRSLIDGQMVANQVETAYLSSSRDGALAIQMSIAVDSRAGASLDKAEAALFKELTRLRNEPPSESELARARIVLEKKFVDETSSYLGRARALANAETTGAGIRSSLDYSARLGAIRAEDVQRVAKQYLVLSNTSIHEYEPRSAPARTFDSDTFAATVKTWAPAFDAAREPVIARAPEAKSSSAPAPQASAPDRRALLENMQPLPIKDFSTLNGPKAFVREDHSKPIVTVAILFQGGRVIEDNATSGMTELMLRSILYGTPRRSYSELNDEWDALGADVKIVVEPDFYGFMLSVLSRNADRALKLVRDAIEEPAFRDEDIARARLRQVASIRDARDSRFVRSKELLLQAMFPGNAYSLPPHGREEVITAATSEKIADWYARVIKRQLPVAIIVGDTAGSALVSSQLAEGFKRRDVETAIQVKTPKPVTGAEKIEARQSEHATVAIGFPGPKGENLDQTAIQLIECALNGEGGRLIRELRDKQALVRAAVSNHESLFAAGVVSAFATTSAGDEQPARAALVAEMERIARSSLDEGEIATARALATNSRIVLLQSQSHHALLYARAVFYQQPAASVDSFEEQVSKVTAEDIKRIAANYFKTSVACAGVVRGSPPATPSTPKQP